MALQSQMVRVDLGMGIDQKTDPKLVLPGRLLTAQNARFAKTGRLEPRNGWTNAAALPAGGIQRLYGFNGQPLMISAPSAIGSRPTFASYVQSTGTIPGVGHIDSVCAMPTVPFAKLTPLTNIAPTAGNVPTFVDSASAYSTHSSTLVATLIGAAGSVVLSLVDNITGNVSDTFTPTVSGINVLITVRVLFDPIGTGKFYVVCFGHNGYAILSVDPHSSLSSSVTQVFTSANTGRGNDSTFDATLGVVGGTARVFTAIEHIDYGGGVVTGAHIYLDAVNSSGWASTGTATVAITAVPGTGANGLGGPGLVCLATPIAISAMGNLTMCATDGSADSFWYMQFNNVTLATVTTLKDIDTGSPAPTSFTAVEDQGDVSFPLKIMASYSEATHQHDYIASFKVAPSSAATLVATNYGLRLSSKMSLIGDGAGLPPGNRAVAWAQHYAHFTSATGCVPVLQAAYFLVQFGVVGASTNETDPLAMIGRDFGDANLANIGDGNSTFQNVCRELPSLSPSDFVGGQRCATLINVTIGQSVTAAMDFSTDPHSGWLSQVSAGALLFSGGYLAQYDGVRVRQCGVFLAPDITEIGTQAVGGGKTGGGTYSVVAVYTHMDALGRKHRSPISSPQSITLGAGNHSFKINVTAPRVGVDVANAQVEIYCTTNGGTIYFLETAVAPQAPLPHEYAAIGLSLADTAISANAPIYISGNVADDFAVDAPIGLAATPTRVLVSSGSRSDAIQPSKEILTGVGLGFYQDVFEPIRQLGDVIRAIAFLAGRMFALKTRSLFVSGGDGPDLTGANDTIGVFEAFSLEVGVLDPASAVVTTFGIVFRSARGFYMLGRDGGLDYIGADVEDALSGSTVIDAAYCEDAREARFLLNGGLSALVLTFYETRDGIARKWSTDLYNSPVTAIASIGSSFVGAHTSLGFLTQSPHVGDSFTGTPLFPVVFETGWLSLAGVQGFARWYRIFILGQTLAGFDPTEQIYVDIAYDYVDTYAETRTDTYANATFDGSQFQLEVRTKRHKAQAMKLRIRNGNADTRCTFALSGIAIQAGMRTAPEIAAQKRI
jgi:hypothetical protein